MCDCRKKLKDLAEFHKWCSRNNRYETVLFDKPVETTLEIICDKLPEIKIEPETISKEIVKMVVDDFVSEIIVYKEEPISDTQQDKEEEDEEEEDDTVELTDISPEELLQQEEEEKRIRDELALIQLTKLTKKRIRTKK